MTPSPPAKSVSINAPEPYGTSGKLKHPGGLSFRGDLKPEPHPGLRLSQLLVNRQ
jgi:hypothetical protein